MNSLKEVKNKVAIDYGFDSYDDFRVKFKNDPKFYRKYYEGISDNIAILYSHQAVDESANIADRYESEPPFGMTKNAILELKNNMM